MASISDFSKIAFFVSGGLGKNIVSTAVIKNIKNQYPDKEISVVASWPNVFWGNPNVKKVYRMGAENLYDDIIDDDEVYIIREDPYMDSEYIHGKKHIIKAWCDKIGIECKTYIPDIYFSAAEEAEALFYKNQLNKPLFLIQVTGGANPENQTKFAYIKSRETGHKRDLDFEVAQKVVNRMMEDYAIIQVKTKNQPTLENVNVLESKAKVFSSLLKHADKVLLIDSFLQHAAAALNIPSVVCWSGTSPDCLGYELHSNIRNESCPTPECHRPSTFIYDSFADHEGWRCPYKEKCRQHDVKAIMKALTGKEEENDKKEILIGE
jgi:hypothetical protein